MPAWSHEIANEIIELALADDKAFDQMHLQELVYIAHGWCLAITGQPLTGDRPEALKHGPEYRRLADALARWGVQPITSQIEVPADDLNLSKTDATSGALELFSVERDILRRVYAKYAHLQTCQLASLTRANETPWDHVFAGGTGNGRDIPHKLIRSQFEEVARNIGPEAGP